MSGEAKTVRRLQSETEEFFKLHWCQPPLQEFNRKWSSPWRFIGSIPNNDLQGVYALLSGDEVIYIGSGASRNAGRYSGAGLGARLSKYWKMAPGQSGVSLSDRIYTYAGSLKDPAPDLIVTFGLEKDFGYLAPSLEGFLIIQLRPKFNKIVIGTVE